MARTPRWVRSITGISVLTTTTQFIDLTPASIPDQSTCTRIVGNAMFDFAPDRDPAASPAALIAAGIGMFAVPAAIDVALPNDFPTVFMWWRYQVLRAANYGTYVDGFAPNSMTIDFDVAGQRRVDYAANYQLYLWARLVTPLVGVTGTPVASIRLGISHLYLLPEA